MSRLPAGLMIYRLVSRAAAPFAPMLLARRAKRGKEHRQRLSERRGESRIARPDGPLIWLHGASVGELASVLPLIERIRARDIPILVTTGTVTSGDLAEQRLPRGVVHQFMPVDVPRFVGRFLDHWRPDLALFVESDLWPNMIIEASDRGVPMVLVNGRLSENSFRRWRRLPNSIAHLLQRLDLCLTGTAPDATRFGELGAPQVFTTGNLKLDVPAPPADPAALAALRDAIGDRPVIAAASTHAGEEDPLLEAHIRLRANFPGLLTLIAPRHPERGAGIVAVAARRGPVRGNALARGIAKRAIQISMSPTPLASSASSIAWHPLSSSAARSSSMAAKTRSRPPSSAPQFCTARMSGTFAEIYAALDDAHGAEPVAGPDRLVAHLAAWLSDPDACARVADAGHTVVETLGGALDRTLASLDPYLMQLQLHQRARHA